MSVHRQSFQGQTFEPNATQAPRLALTESLDFEFLAHPANYDVFEVATGKYEILPVLRRVQWHGGKNGMVPYRTPPQVGRTGNAMPYVATLIQQGWVHVPGGEVEAFGSTVAGYTHGFQIVNGDWHFADVWSRPYLVGAVVYWDKDTAGYHAFLRSVSKLMPAMDANVRKGLLARIASLHSRRRKNDPDSNDTALLGDKVKHFKTPKRSRAKPAAEAPSV